MKMVKFLICSAIIFLTNSVFAEHVNIANPASEYCTEQGGFYELKDNFGICKFMELKKGSDGRYYVQKSECEEWAFFRNECSKGSCGKWHYDPTNSYCEKPLHN